MNSKTKALILTARPKTLSAAVVPVLVATALAAREGFQVQWWISVCALFSAIFIQVGTNFVNDALDFVKGADTETRLGEARAAQSGWFSGRTVMTIGLVCFLVALLLGIPLVMHGGWPILAIGVFSLLFGYLYTGGPFPLAYVGLGDLFVFFFFGLVAVGGVFFLQTGTYLPSAAIAGTQVGLFATVLIAINNLRDLNQDALVGKRTLAVRLGKKAGLMYVISIVVIAFAFQLYWLHRGWLVAGILPLVLLRHTLPIFSGLQKEASREYNLLLARAAFVHMIFGVTLSLGLIFG